MIGTVPRGDEGEDRSSFASGVAYNYDLCSLLLSANLIKLHSHKLLRISHFCDFSLAEIRLETLNYLGIQSSQP